MCVGYCRCEVYATLFFFSKCQVRGFLVQPKEKGRPWVKRYATLQKREIKNKHKGKRMHKWQVTILLPRIASPYKKVRPITDPVLAKNH